MPKRKTIDNDSSSEDEEDDGAEMRDETLRGRSIIPFSKRKKARNGHGVGTVVGRHWKDLAAYTMQLTVDSLARISGANVEALTVAVAQSLLGALKLSLVGEERIQVATASLGVLPSFDKGLTFGFGNRHLVRSLAGSAEGLSCIAVCACLTEFYSTRKSANILRELFLRIHPPQYLSPSLREWIALVEVAQGVLATSEFGTICHQISRLYRPDSTRPAGLTARESGKVSEISLALDGLMKLSDGTITTMTIIGGADCAWFGAVAQWLLNARVVVKDVKSDDILYQASQKHDEDTKKGLSEKTVIILYDSNHDQAFGAMDIVGRAYTIASVRALLVEHVKDGRAFSGGRVQWDHLIGDVFGAAGSNLVRNNLAEVTGMVLGCMAQIFEKIKSGLFYDKIPWYGVGQLNSGSYGRGFLRTIKSWLPEIRNSPVMVVAMDRTVCKAFTNFELLTEMFNLYGQIISCCKCMTCTKKKFNTQTSRPEIDQLYAHIPDSFCSVIILEVICVLARTLSQISMEGKGILPTHSGIESLYYHQLRVRIMKPQAPGYLNKLFHTEPFLKNAIGPLYSIWENKYRMALAKAIFTGHYSFFHDASTALASNGLTFVYDVLHEPTDDLDRITLLHVIPGGIEWEDRKFARIKDEHSQRYEYDMHLDPASPYNVATGALCAVSNLSLDPMSTTSKMQCKLHIIEFSTTSDRSLSMMYVLSSSRGSFHIMPTEIMENILTAASGFHCRGANCMEQNEAFVDSYLFQGEGNIAGPSLPRNHVLVRILPDVLTRWISLVQKTAYRNGNKLLSNILQTDACLNCCLTKANTFLQITSPLSSETILLTKGDNEEDELALSSGHMDMELEDEALEGAFILDISSSEDAELSGHRYHEMITYPVVVLNRWPQ